MVIHCKPMYILCDAVLTVLCVALLSMSIHVGLAAFD